MGCSSQGGKCGRGSKHLCPFSFGLALGITCFLTVIVGTLLMVYSSMSTTMPGMMPVHVSQSHMWMSALWALLDGFIFGVVLALLYDLFACCCRRSKCCKCSKCGADCPCGTTCRCCDKGACSIDDKKIIEK